MSEHPSYRLPRTAIPRRYEVELCPDLEALRFEGEATIQVDVVEAADSFTLNALGLEIGPPVLRGGGRELVGSVTYRPEVEQAVLAWPERVAPGAWTLSLRFGAELAKDLQGFYQARATGPDGAGSVIAVTDSEPTNARRIFPCWDEPDMKAVFSFSVVMADGLRAFSNAPETSSEALPDGRRRVRFADTMPMSTYLVALAVGRLETSEPAHAGRTPVRVVARPELMGLAAFAREEAVLALRFFEDYFGVPYPAPKLDHVAVPDFSPGAMENLGCVVYREEALLVDRERSSPRERMGVSATIAHETAHMWFGDLVTMRWWNGIWLNEAFATFMQLLASDAMHPDWQVWSTFSRERSVAFLIDGLAATRPIEFPVGPPAEAMAMFDVLTYEKGAAILRMLERYLGADVFRRGITLYLERHRHGSAETADLWAALEAVSGQPVGAVMDSWVLQGGYPLVRVRQSADGRALALSQEPFRYGGGGTGTWQVPVVVAFGRADGTRAQRVLLLGPEGVTVDLPEDCAFVLANAQASGFYRTAYDPVLWQRLIAAWPTLHSTERYALADDVWAAAVAGQGSIAQVVDLWRRFGSERDPDLWGGLEEHLTLLEAMLEDEARPTLHAFARALAQPVLAELTWQPQAGESVQATRLRSIVISLLGRLGRDEAVAAEARRRLADIAAGSPSTDPSLLTVVAMVAAASGGEAEWERMHALFRSAATPQDGQRYLFSLSAFRPPELVGRTLALYASGEVKDQDAMIAIASALFSRHARAAAWALIERDWEAMLRRFRPQMFQHIAYPLATIVEDGLAERVRAWLAAHPVPEAAPQFAQGLEFQALHRAMAVRVRRDLPALLAGG